jgi:hypothetical protein
MEKYIIIKNVMNQNGIPMPVILLNGNDEILEFDSLSEAEHMVELFQTNSDSGHQYSVKKIG